MLANTRNRSLVLSAASLAAVLSMPITVHAAKPGGGGGGGSQLEQKVAELEATLDQAVAAIAVLQTDLAAAEATVTSLQTNLAAETAARGAADSLLQTNL
ncbi:MAG: hypothetical protein JSU66_08835, partial [Deltaproteobacteria bacterium]